MIATRLWVLLTLLAIELSETLHVRRKRQLQQTAYPRPYRYWLTEQIHSTLQQWTKDYPNLVRVTTAQERYGLPTAGNATDCPMDAGSGCLNYILQIQDYLVHPEGSDSSNALPEVLWSGELHGDERIGPTTVMEAASLLLTAAACQGASSKQVYDACSAELRAQDISARQQEWLARLVATRRIVVVPTANALGYYHKTRNEGNVDVNRDFPFDVLNPQECMQSIAARVFNELFLEHLFQTALTFHGGVEFVGYEWGATSFVGNIVSPDDTAQNQIATAYSQYGGSWPGTFPYRVGTMNELIYDVRGGMEDWAYAGSWLPELVIQCEPTTFGGYPAEKTTYNDSVLRAVNMLIEGSAVHEPLNDTLGTNFNVLSKNATAGNGHVARNLRLSLLSADLVEPYLSFVGVNELSLPDVLYPFMEGRDVEACRSINTVAVPSTLGQVTVEWTVGGALEIDDTSLWYGPWDTLSGVDCLMHPPSNLTSGLLQGTALSDTNGTGYFSQVGSSPSTKGAMGNPPLGPVFLATVDLTQFNVGEQIMVLVKARVDQSWVQQADNIRPQVLPQAHLVNARTNATWYHSNAGKVVQGRLEWYSIIPLTLLKSDTTTELVNLSPRVGNQNESTIPPESGLPTLAPKTTDSPTIAPAEAKSPNVGPSSNAAIQCVSYAVIVALVLAFGSISI